MKKWIKRLVGIGLGLFFIPSVILVIISGASASSSAGASDLIDGVVYVEHWTSGDAYTHHFLHQRYGISEKQIEGFIRSQGFEPEGRSSGRSFLEAQAKSGIDVRVLVAFAQMESAWHCWSCQAVSRSQYLGLWLL